jgi:hypothetical protein
VVGRNGQANEQLLALASEGSCAQLWVVTAAKCAGHVEGHLARRGKKAGERGNIVIGMGIKCYSTEYDQ